MTSRYGIGASDAAAACGLSRWKTPLQLYQEKIGESEPVRETLPMRIGKALEPVVLRQFAEQTGAVLSMEQERVTDLRAVWRWVTLDAVADNRAIVEAKTSGSASGWSDDDVPIDYAIQVQHAMSVTGFGVAYIPVLLMGRDFRIYTIERDDEMIEMILKLEQSFWERVIARTPPAPSTLAEINQKYRAAKAGSSPVIASAEIVSACDDMKQAKAKIADCERVIESTEALLKSALGESDTLLSPDGKDVLATWKQREGERLDQKALKEAHADLVAKFMRKSSTRVFLLK